MAGVPGWVEPQLATLTKDRFSDPSWIYERKLDGERILAFRDSSGVRLYTRNQRDVTRDIRAKPQRERKRLLSEALSFSDPLRYTEHRGGDGEEFWRQACRDGWEGLIAKRADAAYEGGRTRNWLKFKCVNSQEFVIGGYTDPKGARQWLGAILVGYYDAERRLCYAGKVGTGFTAGTLRALHSSLSRLERNAPPFQQGKPPRPGTHWTEPRLVAEIGFAEWTSDGLLRQPRFEGLRDDKDPAEVIRETPR